MKAGTSKLMAFDCLVSGEDLPPAMQKLVQRLVWMGLSLLVCSFTFVSTAIVDFIISSVSLHNGKSKGTQQLFF